MVRYYCDYCDIFLTHDTLAVRKAHNLGWKHASKVKEYYSALGQDSTQNVIDRITGIYNGPGPSSGQEPQPHLNSYNSNNQGQGYNQPPSYR